MCVHCLLICAFNCYPQTDLSGIKWRKFSYDCPQEPLGPLEDPVLVSYSRCIAANILSVWRRVPFMNTDLLLSLDVPMKPDPVWTKELWIYWYGDDPNLEEKISPDLKGKVVYRNDTFLDVHQCEQFACLCCS